MTKLLPISASPGAPVACDMTDAQDTHAERLAEYRGLFGHALVDQEATVTSTTYWLADRPSVREWVFDLSGREAACCPFLSIEVHSEGRHLVWRIEGLGAADMAAVGGVLTTADRSDASEGPGKRSRWTRPSVFFPLEVSATVLHPLIGEKAPAFGVQGGLDREGS